MYLLAITDQQTKACIPAQFIPAI